MTLITALQSIEAVAYKGSIIDPTVEGIHVMQIKVSVSVTASRCLSCFLFSYTALLSVNG